MQKLERKLGLGEAYCAYAHKFAGTMLIRDMFLVGGRVTPEAVRAAFSALRDRHPFLDARIVASPQGLHFVRDHRTAEDPIEIYAWDASQDPDKMYDAAGDLRFNETTLLYRFFFFIDLQHSNNILIFVLHHSISDGICTSVICKEFSEYLYSYMEDQSIEARPSYRLPPSIESWLVDRPSKFQFVRVVGRSILGGLICWPPKHECSYERSAVRGKAKTKNIFLSLDQTQTTKIYQSLNNKPYSINTLFSAVFLLAEFKLLNHVYREEQTRRLFLRTPVNCRAHVEDQIYSDEGILCCYATSIANYIRISKGDDIWDVASNVKSAMNRSPIRDPKKGMSLCYSDSFLRNRISRQADRGKSFFDGIGFTFIGNIDSIKKGDRMWAQLGKDLTVNDGTSLIFAVAYLRDGCLQVSISYGMPFLSDESAQSLVQFFVEALPIEGEVSRTRGPLQMGRNLGLLP